LKWLLQKSLASIITFTIVFASFGPSLTLLSDGHYAQQAHAEEGMKKKVGDFAATIVSFAVPVLMIVTKVVGALLSNEMIYGAYDPGTKGGSTIGDVLNAMWVMMRNIANYIFVLVLLAIAFMTVMSAGGKDMGFDFDVKSIFPKLIVAIVAVNLTWFGCKVILDTASVATHVVFGIPQSFGSNFGVINKMDERFKNCKEREPNVLKTEDYIKNNDLCFETPLMIFFKNDANNRSQRDCPSGSRLISYGNYSACWKRVDDWKAFIRGDTILELFLYGFLYVDLLPIAASNATQSGTLFIHSLAALVITIVVFLALLVMVLALLERVIVIWINIILSPLGAVMWVVEGMGLSSPSNESLGLSAFLKMSFLPAMMAAPLVLGFMMVAAGKMMEGGADSILAGKFKIDDGSGGEQTKNMIEGLQNIIPHMSTIHQILWFLLVVGVMWTSVSIAESMTNFTKSAISGIKGAAETPLALLLNYHFMHNGFQRQEKMPKVSR